MWKQSCNHSSRAPWWRRRRSAGLAGVLLLTVWLGTGLYHTWKPPPPGLDTATPLRPATDVALLADHTYVDALGNRRTDHVIFDEILRLIDQARRLVVLDMFLFNDFAGATDADMRPLSEELTRALIQRRRERPELVAVLITDPFNTLYGGMPAPHLRALEAAGVQLIMTDLSALRDSNPAWSALWRLCCSWWKTDANGGWLPNPVGPGTVNLSSYLQLLNFKANHRKTLVVDAGDDWVGLVSSANPHDASSAHSNVALRFSGRAALDLLATERAVARLSGAAIDFQPRAITPARETPVHVQILTEAAIRTGLLGTIETAQRGERIDIAVFYFAHERLLQALLRAQRRGVQLRVLLDPNLHAFGRLKSGIPNRPLAARLHEAGIPVRWCDTHGEQCHSKFLLHTGGSGDAELILGSANFTRRNLDNYNLETDVRLLAPEHSPVIQEALAFFSEQWLNQRGRRHSVAYEHYQDEALWRRWQYRLMEATGLSTF